MVKSNPKRLKLNPLHSSKNETKLLVKFKKNRAALMGIKITRYRETTNYDRAKVQSQTW